jgi:CRISPR-associated protein Cas1
MPPGRSVPTGAAAALPDYLPARMLNEFVYCPRLFFYEWVEGVFAHSADTVEGALRHEKLERKADPLPPPDAAAAGAIHARSVELSSEEYKLIAHIDLVEGTAGAVCPVDYKKGAPQDTDDGPAAWAADRAQVCAQALILRDNGYRCDEAVVFYSATKQRVRVAIDDALIGETLAAAVGARRMAARGRIPPPLVDSPKCARCSLVAICLPDETRLAMADRDDDTAQLELFADDPVAAGPSAESPAVPDVRRLIAARDDLRPLYLAGHDLTVGQTGEVLQVRRYDRGRHRSAVVQEVRLGEISQVNVLGNIQLTAAAIRGLCTADKPIAHFSFGGWFYGLTHGLGLKNVFLRREQFRRADDPRFCMRLARDLVASKIRNQRTILQRNHIEPPPLVLLRLKRMAQQAQAAETLDELLGIEGSAARFYFQHFAGMVKTDGDADTPRFDFETRNRRPPRDPINALLSFAYALLVKELTVVCYAIGFDPFLGFYHQLRFGRPALALDLMEGFRPLVADSAVLTAVNTGMVSARDFLRVGHAVALTPTGRKAFIRAFEQRIDTLVTHPLFNYRVTYRRVFEIQARLLARLITGEIFRYPGFETR